MNWSTLSALPLGLVMFAGLALGYFRRKSGHRKAQEDFPGLAKRLKLEYRAPRSRGEVGQLYGRTGGFQVFVDPDEQRKLIVRFNGAPNLDLRNYETLRRPSGTVPFVALDQSINSFLKTRYAEPKLAERLHDSDLAALLAPFRERYRRELKELNLTEHGVTCVLDFGYPRYLPAEAIEVLIPAMVALAKVIEPKPSE